MVGPCGDSGADQTPRLAVFDIEVKRVKLSREVVSDLRDYLNQGLAASHAFRVVPKEQLRRALVREKQRSYKMCFAKTCQIEVGKALSADHSLATAIKKLGGKCVVSAVIFNLKTEVSESAAQAKGECGVEQIMASMDKVVAKLTGQPVTPSPPPPRPPEPVSGEKPLNHKPSPGPEPVILPSTVPEPDSGANAKIYHFKIRIQVLRTKANGKAWDAWNGKPDIVFTLDGNRSAMQRNGFFHSDSFTSPKPKGPWQITILDKDIKRDDLVGDGFVLLGTNQVIGRASVTISR